MAVCQCSVRKIILDISQPRGEGWTIQDGETATCAEGAFLVRQEDTMRSACVESLLGRETPLPPDETAEAIPPW